ncbi:MAG: zinc-ribbon domain-containing protein [Prevotella sp.]|nr:zinc-ribbon domain-containing protein [Prevotella sp.]
MIMIKCQHCGKQIPYDANLCPYCGRSIKQFQQKEVLDDEQESDSIQESSESLTEKPLAPQPDSDKKWLFYIIALLAMLLIVGAVYHYSTRSGSDEDAEDELIADTTAVKVQEDSVDVKTKPVKYNPKKVQRVVVNGEGVRLRFGPSLKAGYLKDEKGATKSVKKGTQLECIGEEGDWYHVVYQNKKYYMSKQFSYLVE